MGNKLLSLFFYFHFLLVVCNGELVLYIQSNDNGTACPDANTGNCRLLLEYAADPYLLLESYTTFLFLPGTHILEILFVISNQWNVSSLTFAAFDPQQDASISCNQRGAFYLQGLHAVIVSSLEFSSCNITTASVGRAAFDHCNFTGIHTGPALVYMAIGNTTIRECKFVDNTAEILYIADSLFTFSGNQVARNSGPWVFALTGIHMATFSSNTFINNIAYEVSVIALNKTSLAFTGTNIIDGNFGHYGILSGFNYTMFLNGTANFTNNYGTNGLAIAGTNLELYLQGYINFEKNSGVLGGAICALNSNLYMLGNVAFVANHARHAGSALCSVSSTVKFSNRGNVTFLNNSADYGGAMFLSGDSSILFVANIPGSAIFQNNLARKRGGAIFIQDTNTFSYCLADVDQTLGAQRCTFEVLNYNRTASYQKRLYFVSNYAQEAGSTIYGGAVDRCLFRSATNAIRFTAVEVFDNIVDITSDTNNTPSSTVSSGPFIVCTCEGNKPNCANASVSRTVFPGGSLQLAVIALGQRNGVVPATITTYAQNLTVHPQQTASRIPNQCTNLTYTVYAEPGQGLLELTAEGVCLSQGIGVEVKVEVLSCPPGLVMSSTMGETSVCTCDPRLLDYTDTCSAQDGTIVRDDFWVGYDQELDGLILSSNCPFDYCISETMNLNIEDSDTQCNHDRSGLLCGECSGGLSLVLGSSSCEKCSDDYLALLLFFAVAGVILVAFLLLLNLTVAIGTINGLIFYANIVAANEALVFPSKSNTYLNILKVFIAWINLDFGINSCFYDGMDQYAKSWLQYVFPVYIWVIIGVVFLVSHYSRRAAKILGSNPVAVLATLILLSYTKVLRSIIEAFSSATLDYPQGESRVVWLYDGNVPFLDTSDGRHLGLFVASLLVLVVLFIPYTLLLLTSQWLQIKSHWKVLSWLNKPQLRAFLDAYHAAYKPRHRYWTGLLLLLRLALLITSSCTTAENPSVNLLVVQLFVFLVQMWGWINGGIYKKWYLDIIEAFFFLNLDFLMLSIHHIKLELYSQKLSSDEYQMAQRVATSTLLSTTVAAFIGILVFHIYLKFRGREQIDTKRSFSEETVDLEKPVGRSSDFMTTSVWLRESLLA